MLLTVRKLYGLLILLSHMFQENSHSQKEMLLRVWNGTKSKGSYIGCRNYNDLLQKGNSSIAKLFSGRDKN